MNEFRYNRVMKQSDMALLGVSSRKEWEIEMALKTLRDHGVVHEEAEILGVGAGTEATTFHLSNDVKRVWATDIYAQPGDWNGWHGVSFMVAPMRAVPYGVEYDIQRIVVQHMDMTNIWHPDDTFDGIFSSGSIEHVGIAGIPDYAAIRSAAREIGRVLKPGGIASISTEWKLAGEGWGWGHVRLFDEALLMEHIVEPSGLEWIDEPDWAFDGDLMEYVTISDIVHKKANEAGFAVMAEHQYKFTSVHLAMRKPE